MTEQGETLSESEVRGIAREESSRAVRSALSTIAVALVALFVVVAGNHLLRSAVTTSGTDAILVGAIGTLVVGSGLYLLYALLAK
jgi:hypothetical protein